MIASLNIMAKTFAKAFVGLLRTIVSIRRKHVLILHLEAKYAKMDYKNGIYAKNWVRSTWTEKVNSVKKSTVEPSQSQPSKKSQRMTSAILRNLMMLAR